MQMRVATRETGETSFALPAVPSSIGQARSRMIAVAAAVVGEERLGELRLVISEVVTNAVRHGENGGELLLSVTPKDGFLCVRVTDEGAGFAPRPRASEPDENGGWGLFLIEQLTRRWGLTRERGRTRVWFEFDC